MEKKNLCPKCGSENTEHLHSEPPKGKPGSYLVDLEMHPLLYRCSDCGEVFPGDGFPLPDLPERV